MKRKLLSENKWIHINLNKIIKSNGKNPDLIGRDYRGDFYSQDSAVAKLIQEGLAEGDKNIIYLTEKGERVRRNGGWLPYLRKEWNKELEKRKEENEKEILNQKLKEFQIEKLEYEQTIREKEEEIRTIDKKLKKWKLFGYRWWITGIIFSALTFVLSHLKEFQIILNQLWQWVAKQ